VQHFGNSVASLRRARKLSRMIELEVYAAGLRDLNKILELDHQVAAVRGPITTREIRAIFNKLELDPCFIGAMPSELRPKSKTQPLSV